MVDGRWEMGDDIPWSKKRKRESVCVSIKEASDRKSLACFALLEKEKGEERRVLDGEFRPDRLCLVGEGREGRGGWEGGK